MYIHGTYRPGWWTCHLDRVDFVVGGEVGTAGEGGKRVLSVAVASIVAKFSM